MALVIVWSAASIFRARKPPGSITEPVSAHRISKRDHGLVPQENDQRNLRPELLGEKGILDRLIRIANEAGVSLSNARSLALSDSAVALLDMTPEQAQQLNAIFGAFLDNLRREEVKHAYVEIDAEGNEQIVVPPFDRTGFINALRSEVSLRINPVVGGFISEGIQYDGNLAVGNFKMRVYLKREIFKEIGDTSGSEFETFERNVAVRPHLVNGRPGPLVRKLISKRKYSEKTGFDIRTRHLWNVVSDLPKRKAKP